MARNIYGLDLGTYEIKIFDKKKVRIWREKNVIAMKDKKYIFSVGNEAYKMYEKAPENVEILFPMKNGVIARFDDMQYLLGSLLKTDHQFARGAEYMIAVPTDVTEVEKKAFYDLVMHSEAKAKSVRIVERGLADAVGLGLDVMNETGIFIANFGGGTTELSVLSRGGMVMNRLLKTGGETLDAAIAGRVRRNREFLIGKSTAERLRKEFAVFEDGTEDAKRVYGRDLTSGVPAHTEIQISLVRAAVKEPLEECAEAIRSMLTRTPPDVRRAIEARGIYLTGGVAGLKGFPTYLGERTGLKVFTVPDPELCAVKALKTCNTTGQIDSPGLDRPSDIRRGSREHGSDCLCTFFQRLLDRRTHKTDLYLSMCRDTGSQIPAIDSFCILCSVFKYCKFFSQTFSRAFPDQELPVSPDPSGNRCIQRFSTGLQQPVHDHSAAGKHRQFCSASTKVGNKNPGLVHHIQPQSDGICQSPFHNPD